MLCSPLIDRWQQMNSQLSLWANQTLRFTYSSDRVLQQQRPLLLAPHRLQTAALSEGQDFCLCRRKQVFSHKTHTFIHNKNNSKQTVGEKHGSVSTAKWNYA